MNLTFIEKNTLNIWLNFGHINEKNGDRITKCYEKLYDKKLAAEPYE
jgi:hypothetical protein